MEMQTALLIFIVVFALAIGFFLGLFLISLDAPFLKKLFQKDESAESPDAGEAEMAPGVAAAESQLKKPTPESQMILRVWKEEGKPPVYEVDGEYLEKEALPKEILHVITLQEELPKGPETTPPPFVEETVPEPVQELEKEDDDDDEGEIKMLSVVDEVNNILQRKLHGSPLAGKGIHMMENHNQEIRFWVGLESYNDVSEIPDPEIRKMIDDAVREWEQNRE